MAWERQLYAILSPLQTYNVSTINTNATMLEIEEKIVRIGFRKKSGFYRVYVVHELHEWKDF